MKEVKLKVLIGPPASGKSTYTKKRKSKYKSVSSDKIRFALQEELGDRYKYRPELNGKIFAEYHKQIEDYLLQGHNVIADATNMTVKDRNQYFDITRRVGKQGIKVTVEAILFISSIETLIVRDEKREAKVGAEVILHSLKRFKAPNIRTEGWDLIQIIQSDIETPGEYREKLIERAQGFDQKNPYHQYDLGGHQKDVWERLKKAGHGSERMKDISETHDLGKLYTMTVDEKGMGHFYGHAGVSTYIYFKIAPPTIDFEEMFARALIIERHMAELDKWSVHKAKRELGEEVLRDLVKFWEIDKEKEISLDSSIGKWYN